MHPSVSAFISDLLYEVKLRSAPGRDRQTVTSAGIQGTGLGAIRVEHAGNRVRSIEEARVVAAEVDLLLRTGTVTDADGHTRAIEARDVIVVSPYNAQVKCIAGELARRGIVDVQVGTVDKFQGREAFVVFYSTAASSPEEAARGVGFVFDRQRFNVAVSRARALAVLVGSPALVELRPGSVEAVYVANGLFRFLETALPGAGESGGAASNGAVRAVESVVLDAEIDEKFA